MYRAAVDIPKRKLEQAATKSNEKALTAPICVATYTPVAATGISGVAVAIITMSISAGSVLLFLSKSLAASIARNEVPLSLSFNILLSLIPVRVVIHSSLVSTMPARILLVST